jgi:ElaB/YqjD/DUF883 family membrane-anchored ribosome-binding protein
MTNTASGTGREGSVDQAASQLQNAAASAQEKAVELKSKGRNKLSVTLDERTSEVGGQARKMAQALRHSGQQMRVQGDGQQVAGIAEGAADRIERLGGYLEETSGNDLLRDVEEFARRRPWLVAGIGVVAGLAGSRFLKASSERRYGPIRETQGSVGHGYGAAATTPRAYEEPVGRTSYSTSG